MMFVYILVLQGTEHYISTYSSVYKMWNMKFSISPAKNKTEIRLQNLFYRPLILFFCFFFPVLGTGSRTLLMPGKYSTTEVHGPLSLQNYSVMSNLSRKCLMKLERWTHISRIYFCIFPKLKGKWLVKVYFPLVVT